MIATVIAFLLKLGASPLIDKALRVMERRAELETDKEKLKTQVTIEAIRATVEETKVMASFNEKKLNVAWFWLMIALFVVPYGLWWNAVFLDSIFHFGWKIADIPNNDMKQSAAAIIQWLFYVGSGAAIIKAIR